MEALHSVDGRGCRWSLPTVVGVVVVASRDVFNVGRG